MFHNLSRTLVSYQIKQVRMDSRLIPMKYKLFDYHVQVFLSKTSMSQSHMQWIEIIFGNVTLF